MAAPTLTPPTVSPAVPIVIIGTDAVLAASPATPVQLAHACLRAGFANVIPASWGDELIANAVLRRLPQFGSSPAIQCSCPIVAHRLLSAGGDLRPVLLPLVPPPVALARYVRAFAKPSRVRITYVGACPGAVDESIDIRMTADALIAMLAERDIVLDEQPRVFESIIPPDRRRFRSLPGGVPNAEALWTELGSRTLVEIDGDDFVGEVVQHLLSGKNILIDASTRLGCACSGAVGGMRNARSQIASLEPPRATAPVIDESAPIDLDLPIPAVPRAPVDVVSTPATSHTPPGATPPHGLDAVGNRRAGNVPPDQRPGRLGTPTVPRPVMSGVPVARDVEGKALPRAYVARRRSSPRGVTVELPPEESAASRADQVRSEAAHQPLPPAPPVVAPETPALSTPLGQSVSSPITPAPLSNVPAPAESTPTPPTAEPERSHVLKLDSVTPSSVEQQHAPEGAPSSARPAIDPNPVYEVPSFLRQPAPARATIDPPPPPRPSRQIEAQRPSRPGSTSGFSRGQIVMIVLAAVAIAIFASTVVAVIVAKSVNSSTTSTPLPR